MRHMPLHDVTILHIVPGCAEFQAARAPATNAVQANRPPTGMYVESATCSFPGRSARD
jgi:hypothetical protein